MTREQAQEQTGALTRRFARRQESWFRPDPRITWLDPRGDGSARRPSRSCGPRSARMSGMSDGLAFTKGHGTENDFVLVPDLDGVLDLLPSQVARLADRRAGIGGDGVIRVVPTRAAAEEDVRSQSSEADWFMDYRNADGSPAEMCGNGTRVFAAYLRREGLETADEFPIATRAGVKHVRFEPGGLIAVNLGSWRFADLADASDDGIDALVHLDGHQPFSAVSLDLGNPHTVVALPEAIDLAGLDLSRPRWSTLRPARHERGVRPPAGPGAHQHARPRARGRGDSLLRHRRLRGRPRHTVLGGRGAPDVWTVDVPGGRLRVTALPGQEVELAGPAELVADGMTTLL